MDTFLILAGMRFCSLRACVRVCVRVCACVFRYFFFFFFLFLLFWCGKKGNFHPLRFVVCFRCLSRFSYTFVCHLVDRCASSGDCETSVSDCGLTVNMNGAHAPSGYASHASTGKQTRKKKQKGTQTKKDLLLAFAFFALFLFLLFLFLFFVLCCVVHSSRLIFCFVFVSSAHCRSFS